MAEPGGLVFPVREPVGASLDPGGELTVHLFETIPANAPPGGYRYDVKIGLSEQMIRDVDGFDFTVLPPAK